MRSNTELHHGNILKLLLLASGLITSAAHADRIIACHHDQLSAGIKKICSTHFDQQRNELNNKTLSAYLISDAPMQLLQDTQQLWLQRLTECKSKNCVEQQFELRFFDLDLYTSMKQSLTQHYIKFENGKIATQPVHFKIHQLSKDRIKIEGIAYRNPNNRTERQIYPFLAYTTPEQKQHITDNEHNCSYQFDYQKALLKITTQQKGCERFTGLYRLYD